MTSAALPLRQQDYALTTSKDDAPVASPSNPTSPSFLGDWLPSPLVSIPAVLKPQALARFSLSGWSGSETKQHEDGSKPPAQERGGLSLIVDTDVHHKVADHKIMPLSSGSVRSRMSRRYSAPKQTFQLAYPPPRKIKPRLLLQLQHVSLSARPTPAFDVVPATLVNKKARRVSRSLKSGDAPSRKDLAVLPADVYEHDISHPGDNDEPRPNYTKEPCGIIAFGEGTDGSTDGGAELILSDGSSWMARALRNGNFEFESVDKNGRHHVARWVARASDSGNTYSFSPIDPNSRRHPRIGTLSVSELSVCTSYKPPPLGGRAGSFTRQNVNSSRNSSPVKDAESSRTLETVEEDAVVETSDQLRSLMIVSAVWIAKKEGWSSQMQSFKAAVSLSRRNSLMSQTRGRAASIVSAGSSTPETLSGCEGNPSRDMRAKRRSLPARFSVNPARSGSYSEKQSPLWPVSSEDSLHSATSRSRANTKDSVTSAGTLGSFSKSVVSPPVVQEAPTSEEDEGDITISYASRPTSWYAGQQETPSKLLSPNGYGQHLTTPTKSLLRAPSLTLSVPRSRSSIGHSPVSEGETCSISGKEERKSRRLSAHFGSLKRLIRRHSQRHEQSEA